MSRSSAARPQGADAESRRWQGAGSMRRGSRRCGLRPDSTSARSARRRSRCRSWPRSSRSGAAAIREGRGPRPRPPARRRGLEPGPPFPSPFRAISKACGAIPIGPARGPAEARPSVPGARQGLQVLLKDFQARLKEFQAQAERNPSRTEGNPNFSEGNPNPLSSANRDLSMGYRRFRPKRPAPRQSPGKDRLQTGHRPSVEPLRLRQPQSPHCRCRSHPWGPR